MAYNSKSRNLCSKLWIAFTQNMLLMNNQGAPASHSELSARWAQSSQPPGWGAHLGLAAWFQPQVSILLKQENESSYHPHPSCSPTLHYFRMSAASISQLPGPALWAAVLLQKSHCTVPLIHQGDRQGWHTPHSSRCFGAVMFPAEAELVSRLAQVSGQLGRTRPCQWNHSIPGPVQGPRLLCAELQRNGVSWDT